MFGHKSLPSRVWSYGANPPIENADLVDEQMQLAHRYRNGLVEMEISRRKKVEDALKEMSPKLLDLDKELEKVEKDLEATREMMMKDRASHMHKATRDPAKVRQIKFLKEERKALYDKRKKLRTALFSSRKWKKKQKDIEIWAKEESHRRRAESGIYWGSYLHVEQSMSDARKGAPPRFAHWNGDGHLAVQIQKGMTVQEAFSGEDPRLMIIRGRVEMDGTRTHLTGIKRKLGTALCYFRIGSDEKGGPIFASIPFTMHREIPPTSQIKWVHLIRRRVSTNCEWRLQFVLSQESWEKEDRATTGSVGIDVGWRLQPDGALRVATWVGSDGESGELVLPSDWLGEMRRTEGIRSIRDKNFNESKKWLSEWLPKANKSWLHKDTESLDKWHSQARLAGLVIRWREKRVAGDADIHDVMEKWRKRDKHLYEFEANLRDQLIRRRESIYRNFAAELRRKYKTAKIEALDLRDFHVLPEPEEKPENEAMRRHTRDACLSVLIRCIKESMAETIEKPAKNTTLIHFECGSKEEFDRRQVLHTCTKCGETYDQDENAAKHLLGKLPASAMVT